MVVGAIDQGLGVTVEKNDARITRVGNFLRNWGLDELPQLINVLLGQMSLVGPRPTLAYQVEQYDNEQLKRLWMKPGITSLAVVKGRNSLSWPERIRYDVLYVEQWSFWLDVKILVQTLWVVLITRKGVYGEDGVNDDFNAAKDDV
jgi:lipopolysaccharide/colanic/teichoic acid biosynthesis glycosyltransferase